MNRNFFRSCTLIGAVGMLGVLASCGENPTGAPTGGPSPLAPTAKPALGLIQNINGADGVCLARDAFLSGAVSGVNDDQDLADPTKNCTANDVSVASADILAYSFNGTDFTPYTGQPIQCIEGDPIFLDLKANLKETATSTRTDIGVWIGTNGGNARTGTCNQYNLRNSQDGVSNTDGDQCGDLVNAGAATVPLGVISTICQTATNTSSLLHIGSCLGWTEPGGDQVCPQGGVAADNNLRFGTVPGTTSKCNCSGFDVPIVVEKRAKLEVAKVCSPTTDPSTFDLLIDGSTTVNAVVVGDNKACGTSTGAQVLSAGTNVNPGAVHTFGEGDFTTANYTSSYACVNRVGGAARGSGTSLGPNNITLQPNDDVVCTYTNTRKTGSLTITKISLGGTGVFPYTSTGGLPSPAAAGGGFSITTATAGVGVSATFNNVPTGSYSVTETVASLPAGFSLTDLTCTGGGANTSTAGAVATIGLDENESITCTYTNTKSGSITVTKVTAPASDPQDFAFTTTGTGLSNFSLDTDAGDATYSNTRTFNDLAPGSYTVTEGAATGWALTALSCTTGGSTVLATGVSTITLPAGGNVTCTYTNTKQAQLRIVKETNPDGNTTDFTFTPTNWNGGSTFTRRDNEAAFASGFLTPGATVYSTAETVPAGWALTNRACVYTGTANAKTKTNITNGVSLTLAAGEDVTCTFSNTALSTIIIEKEVLTGGTQSFTFTRTLQGGGADLGDNASPSLQNGGSSSSGKKLVAGTYTVCETNLAAGYSDPTATGYTLTGDGFGNFCTNVTLGVNDSKTIHFINTLPPPSGSTRTIGYWKNWSSCAQSNGGQYDKAIKNGTPQGTLDYYLGGAGVTSIYPIGNITSLTCAQAVNLLSKNKINGQKASGDPIYNMVAQLLGAKLNIAASAGSCQALNDALPQAQTLLVAINFLGTGNYATKNALTPAQVTLANTLAGIFGKYNEGTLGGGCPTHI